MSELFEGLSHAIGGSPAIAIAAAAAWGVLSILLSPCHLASIPLIVGYIARQDAGTARRSFIIALVFSAGILVTIAAIGAITAAAGRMAGDLGPYGNYLVSVVFFAVGLHLADVITIPMPNAAKGKLVRNGLFGAFLLGLVFGIALGPCTFAFMAPVLAASFQTAPTAPVLAVALLAFYGLGHCLTIAAAGASTQRVERWLSWGGRTSSITLLRRICGVLVIVAGLYLVYTA